MTNNIAIIVIGRNEGDRLKHCLQSLSDLDILTVYVDSASTDGSAEYAKSVGVKVVELDKSSSLNAAKARNAGFQWLENHKDIKYIHFIDADCELNAQYLPSAIQFLENNIDVAIVFGRLREKYITKSLYTRFSDMGWYIKPGETNTCGGNATMRYNVFKTIKGFDESLIAGEEPELCKRIFNAGYKIICLDTMMGTHDSAMTHFKQWWVRTVKTGYGFANAAKKDGDNHFVKSIYLWAGIIPVLLVILFLIKPAIGVISTLIYPLQILRISLRLTIPYSFSDKLLYGFFVMLAKFPQLLGIIKYHITNGQNKEASNIEYKK